MSGRAVSGGSFAAAISDDYFEHGHFLPWPLHTRCHGKLRRHADFRGFPARPGQGLSGVKSTGRLTTPICRPGFLPTAWPQGLPGAEPAASSARPGVANANRAHSRIGTVKPATVKPATGKSATGKPATGKPAMTSARLPAPRRGARLGPNEQIRSRLGVPGQVYDSARAQHGRAFVVFVDSNRRWNVAPGLLQVAVSETPSSVGPALVDCSARPTGGSKPSCRTRAFASSSWPGHHPPSSPFSDIDLEMRRLLQRAALL